MGIEIRESSKVYGETSPSGDTTREEKGYDLGAEIDGVWVPFAHVNQGQLDHARQRQEAQQAASGQQSQQAGQQSPTNAADSGTNAPTETHTVAETRASSRKG